MVANTLAVCAGLTALLATLAKMYMWLRRGAAASPMHEVRSLSDNTPAFFQISARSVIVDDRALSAVALTEVQQLVRDTLKHDGWAAADATSPMRRAAAISVVLCSQTTMAARVLQMAGGHASCLLPRVEACQLVVSGFADSSLPPYPAAGAMPSSSALLAIVPLHEQWAANWGGEVVVYEDPTVDVPQTFPRGGALAFLPRPGRVILVDAHTRFAWQPPTHFAQPRRPRQPTPLAFPPESGAAHMVQVAVSCDREHMVADTQSRQPSLPPPDSALRHATPRWSPVTGGGVQLIYGPHEKIHLFDNVWSPGVHQRLTATALRMLEQPRRREKGQSLSLRYHDAIPAGFEEAAALFNDLGVGTILARHLDCSTLALQRAYLNVQSFVDMNEPHQDADAIDPHAEAITALVYPHAIWRDEWAGNTVFLNPSMRDIFYQVAPLPRRLLVFTGTVPHFSRPAASDARPFAEGAPEEATRQDGTNWRDAHVRLSIAFKLTCERTGGPTRGRAQQGACGSRCSHAHIGETTAYTTL